MTQSVTDTTFSPSPFSPFSSYSVASGITSDDAPDLGAFTTVFRALNTLQPRTGAGHSTDAESTTTSSQHFSPSEYESDAAGGSTVWSRDPISSYLSYSSPDSPSRGRSPPASDTDSTRTASDVDRTDLPALDNVDVVDQPSLGYLDEALGFLAAERAKFAAAQRETGLRGNSSATTTTSDSILRHIMPPRRKRRRKKNRSVQEVSRVRASEQSGEAQMETADNADNDEEDGAYESESSVEMGSSSPKYKSTPGTPPPHAKKGKSRAGIEPRPRMQHSKSTPALRMPVTVPFDARALQLRTLAHKMRLFFPEDAKALASILSLKNPDSTTFLDPRGPVPQVQDTLIHIFVDHSNILIGFITYLRRHLNHLHRKSSRHLSYAALALVLERGRPITRRVLVASSPLYQPLDSAEQLGYEVRVYARVPDTGIGADRARNGSGASDTHAHVGPSAPALAKGKGRKVVRGHAHKASTGGSGGGGGGGTSTESENGAGPSSGARIRYREQGVDELLQLKLHQAIADVDDVPSGATIVLATGDGNVGQFNEEGFLGCVRTALKKGWRVELYAWEGGLSRAWMREFGEGPYSSRFQIHMLDRFAADLLEI